MNEPGPLPKIHHFSIAAESPEKVAGALAEILGGRVWPFPAHAGSTGTFGSSGHGPRYFSDRR